MLNLRQIEAFRATLASGSITGASQLLNVSQPSVSRLISDLESRLGFKLFVRKHRGMMPTEEARIFYAQVERSFLGLAELDALAREIRDHARPRVVFGSTAAVSLEFVPEVIADCRKVDSKIQLETLVSSTDHMIDHVRSGRVSLAIISPFEEPKEVDILFTHSVDYVAIMKRNHSFAKSADNILDVRDYPDMDLIIPPRAFVVSKLGSELRGQEIVERARVSVDASFAAAAMARQGMGVALIDPFTARFFKMDRQLVIKPLFSPPRFNLAVIQPTKFSGGDVQHAIVEMIVTKLRAYIPAGV